MNRYDEYYPRPLLRRDSFLSLNGKWRLNGRDVEVPFAPESKLSGYEGDLSKLRYERSFSLPEGFRKDGDKVILHFGAVDQVCDVYLNDRHLLSHEGGYLPFSADISSFLEKDNILVVEARDDLDYFYPFGKQSNDPKGMWYTPVSGIWQSVWLESYPADGIDGLTIKTDKDRLELFIDSRSDEFLIEFEGFRQSFNQKHIAIPINDPHLWSPADPHLYDLKISTGSDEIRSYFALKNISVRNMNGYKRILINDEPVFINGLLDQGYFDKGIYTPEDPADYEKDILGIKELGFNCLRKHIKVEPEAFYYYCDLHGILVIQDMVNSGPYRFFRDTVLPTIGLQKIRCPISDKERYDFFIGHSKETIERLRSHPCILGYTIYNEGWGQQDASGSYDILKALDPERLFDSASGWFFDDHSDFDSYHIYFRNKVLKGKEKLLLLSECGGFIRDVAGHKSDKGSTWGYGKTDSEESLTAKIIEMYEKMYRPSMENGLCGAIMTQISDVEGEINGLYTYDRKVLKVDKEKILEANTALQDLYRSLCK